MYWNFVTIFEEYKKKNKINNLNLDKEFKYLYDGLPTILIVNNIKTYLLIIYYIKLITYIKKKKLNLFKILNYFKILKVYMNWI